MTKEQRMARVIARGEFSNHSHIITGDCDIDVIDGVTIVKTKTNCAIKHLLEREFVEEGLECWTEEHKDIPLEDNKTYEYGIQREYNPYTKLIQSVKD